MPYCPHCNRDSFEFDNVDVSGTKYKCLQCSSCKAPVGLLPSAASGQIHDDFETRVTEVLRVIVSSLQAVSTRLARIEQALQSKG